MEITNLEQPIDAMYLIHKALRGEADRTVEQARSLENGCSLQSFKLAFTAWATAIMYHAEKEVGTEMSKSVHESRRTAACDPVERSNGPSWKKKTPNIRDFLKASKML